MRIQPSDSRLSRHGQRREDKPTPLNFGFEVHQIREESILPRVDVHHRLFHVAIGKEVLGPTCSKPVYDILRGGTQIRTLIVRPGFLGRASRWSVGLRCEDLSLGSFGTSFSASFSSLCLVKSSGATGGPMKPFAVEAPSSPQVAAAWGGLWECAP